MNNLEELGFFNALIHHQLARPSTYFQEVIAAQFIVKAQLKLERTPENLHLYCS